MGKSVRMFLKNNNGITSLNNTYKPSDIFSQI
jgi:hypothetical protein